MSGDSAEPIADRYFGGYRLEGRTHRLWRNDEAVALTPKAAETLVALVDRAGRVVDKDELLRVVWGDVFVGEDTLAQNISTIRRALGDDAGRPQFIATVPRRGYKFIAPVTAAPPAIDGGASPATAADVPPPPRAFRVAAPTYLPLAGAILLATATLTYAVHEFLHRPAPRQTLQFTVAEPDHHRFSATGGMLSVSPDGEHLAYIGVDAGGVPSLWLRPLSAPVARPLAGTEGATGPFWSPDSRTIAFFADRRLNAVDVMSGAVRLIASLSSPRSLGASWSSTNEILFSVPDEGLFLVDAGGGAPRRLMPAPEDDCAGCATWPQFLPDGRRFLFTVVSLDAARSGIFLGEIGKSESIRLTDAATSSAYVAPGRVLYGRTGTLYLQALDTAARRLTGTPVPIADGVAYNGRTGRLLAATSHSGVLAFRKHFVTELVWTDRTGRVDGRAAPPASYHDFAIAPDGRRVVASRLDPRTGTSDVWVFDNGREIRITDDGARDGDPVWSDDGEYVIYSSRRGGKWSIFRRSAAAPGPEELLLETDYPVTPVQALGTTGLIYSSRRSAAPFDLWALDRGQSTPVARVGGFYPTDARLSPDARWLVYGVPDGSAGFSRQTVYVSRPPFTESRRAIAESASMPRWRADGRELFYLSRDSSIVSIPIGLDGTPSDSPGEVLVRATSLAPTGMSGQVYDVTPDGGRFLIKREAGSSPIHVVVNWDAPLNLDLGR